MDGGPAGAQCGKQAKFGKIQLAHLPASAVLEIPHLGGVFKWNTPGPKLLCSYCVPAWLAG